MAPKHGRGEILKAHRRQLEALRPSGVPVLYHYTSVEGALSIVKSAKLWHSSSSGMNDYLEGTWLLHLLDVSLRDRVTEESERANLDLLRHAVFGWQNRAYLTCFSADGDVLSQWRAYAQDGTGMALGFNVNGGNLNLVKGPPVTNAGPDHSLAISEVRYSDSLGELSDAALDAAQRGPEDPCFLEAQIALSTSRWITKKPAFREENEWRIISLPVEFDGGVGGGVTVISEPSVRSFRAAAGRLQSFYEIPFERAALTEIVLGPRSAVDPEELGMLLRDQGYGSIHIRRSDASYRR